MIDVITTEELKTLIPDSYLSKDKNYEALVKSCLEVFAKRLNHIVSPFESENTYFNVACYDYRNNFLVKEDSTFKEELIFSIYTAKYKKSESRYQTFPPLDYFCIDLESEAGSQLRLIMNKKNFKNKEFSFDLDLVPDAYMDSFFYESDNSLHQYYGIYLKEDKNIYNIICNNSILKIKNYFESKIEKINEYFEFFEILERFFDYNTIVADFDRSQEISFKNPIESLEIFCLNNDLVMPKKEDLLINIKERHRESINDKIKQY